MQSSRPFIKKYLRKQKQEQAWAERHQMARANHVTMYRKYRTGDLPDIQIRARDIIIPLQALARRDPTVARNLFSSIFNSLYKQVSKNSADQMKPELRLQFENVFKNTRHNTPFVGCLLKICLEHISLAPPASFVGEAALKSSNYPTGIVLLEKMLNKMSEMDIKKGKKAQQLEEQPKEVADLWNQLSRLYHALREDDIVLGLVDKHISHNPFTKQALEAELKGDYFSAHNIYVKALAHLDSGKDWDGPNPTNTEIDLWEEGKLDCLAKLGKWEDLQKNILVEFPDTDDLFSEKNMDPYLYYYLISHIKHKETWPNLFKFVDSSEGEHKVILEEKFTPELIFVSTSRSDFDRGRYYVNKFFQTFVEDWAPIHPLATAARHKKLQLLQKVIELEEFLDFIGEEKNFKKLEPMKELVSMWRERYPSAKVDDIIVWDNVTTNRALLLERISDKFSTLYGSKDKEKKGKQDKQKSTLDLRQIKSTLLLERSELYHRMSIGARKLGNLPVADNYIKLSFKDNGNMHEFSYQQMHSLVKLYTTKAKKSDDPVDSVDKFVKALKFVKKNESKVQNQDASQQRLHMLTAGVYRDLLELAGKHADAVVNSIENNQFADLPALASLANVSAQRVTNELFNRAYKCLQEAVALSKEGKGSAKAFLKFGLFCDNALKQRKESSIKADDNELLASSVVSNIMEAMRLATPGAIDRFPRLLEVINNFPKVSKEFIQKAKTVPCWMFIRWISQMLAVLDKSEGPAVFGILMEIARTYPAAIFYPFKISSEHLRNSTPQMTEQLQAVLKHPLLDTLVTHLGLLTHPEHRFKDWMELLKPMIRPDRNEEEIKAAFRDMMDDVLNSSNPNFGDYNREFARKWAGDVTAHFGKDGSKLAKMEPKKFAEVVNTLAAKQKPPSGFATMKLKDFSIWLAEFDQSNYPSNEFIELPGQYSGYEQPQPESHVRVSSFDPTLLVMSSLRKPKRLKMRGNDERDYPFLVKGGEDLRLDQRVQQLFSVMNTILRTDPACCKRKLGLKTYQVVPMTTRVGMIEWINNTMPLKEIIEKQLTKPGHNKVEISKIEAANDHQKWLDRFANKVKDAHNVSALYHAMIHHATRDATLKKVEDQYKKIPRNLLQKGIETLAASPEAYLFIRNQFARSLATFNICSYIIGIGDRHLDNFLLNQADGRLVGIDFGHAFGTATQFLMIPELMPFRLTRQFTQFLQPLDSEGLLNHNMVHCLSAMQANKDILLNTMDVFVKEPLLDWQKFAMRLAKEQGKGKDVRQWFPAKKIEIVKMKLDGYNPAVIFSQEIRESTHAGKDYEEALHKIIRGDPKFNIRAKVKDKCTSAKEQVECLVDMATDGNILGRTWGGWAPWI